LEENPGSAEACDVGFLEKHWGAISAVLVTGLFLYLQLLVWRKHGDDLMLTAGSIVVTLALWLLLLVSIVRYWKAAKGAAISAATKVDLALPARLQSAQQVTSSFPSLSALHGQVPQVTFDAAEWFRRAYFSPLTAEFEHNIKIAAERNNPGDHEVFYARFIGVGTVSYLHDITWAYIYKSQLFMLAELNRRNLSLAEAQTYYDKAVPEYPSVYANYSFRQWLNYLKNEQLLIVHPSDMVEITHRGKDLLKYLAHWGRDANARRG
jgi:hypothetical protein